MHWFQTNVFILICQSGCSHLSREAQTVLSTKTSTTSSGRTPRCSWARCELLAFQCVLGLPWGLDLAGHVWIFSPGRCPGGAVARCPNHLSWFLLINSRSTPSSSPYLSGSVVRTVFTVIGMCVVRSPASAVYMLKCTSAGYWNTTCSWYCMFGLWRVGATLHRQSLSITCEWVNADLFHVKHFEWLR